MCTVFCIQRADFVSDYCPRLNSLLKKNFLWFHFSSTKHQIFVFFSFPHPLKRPKTVINVLKYHVYVYLNCAFYHFKYILLPSNTILVCCMKNHTHKFSATFDSIRVSSVWVSEWNFIYNSLYVSFVFLLSKQVCLPYCGVV